MASRSDAAIRLGQETLQSLKVSEESLGPDETPRQTDHELFSHKYLTIILL